MMDISAMGPKELINPHAHWHHILVEMDNHGQCKTKSAHKPRQQGDRVSAQLLHEWTKQASIGSRLFPENGYLIIIQVYSSSRNASGVLHCFQTVKARL